jgi:hypothetical protein
MPSLGSILVKRSPFSTAEIQTLRAFADEMGFLVPYTPGGNSSGADDAFSQLLGPRAAAFTAQFPYDVSPVVDDRPFFFNRVPVLHWLAHRLGLSRSNLGRAPLGLGGQTLLISLGTTAAATLLLLLLPYWAGRRRAGEAQAWRRRGARWAIYFAGLGLGFILVEIVLIQRFSLFLGYPVYSLSVVLFTMLLASGVGSLVAGRATHPRALPRALGALAATLLLYAAGLPPLLARARGLPIAARILIAVVAIAPLGFLMGIPFASGVRRAGRESRALVSWAWAVNGGASVFGSTLTVLISMTYGFTASFLAGALAYALAFAVVRTLEVTP